jgi:hypothetical protein
MNISYSSCKWALEFTKTIRIFERRTKKAVWEREGIARISHYTLGITIRHATINHEHQRSSIEVCRSFRRRIPAKSKSLALTVLVFDLGTA